MAPRGKRSRGKRPSATPEAPLPPAPRAGLAALDSDEHSNDGTPEREMPILEQQDVIPMAQPIFNWKQEQEKLKKLEKEMRKRILKEMEEKKRKEEETARAREEKNRLEAYLLQRQLDKAKQQEKETTASLLYRECAYQAKRVEREKERVEFERNHSAIMEDIVKMEEALEKKRQVLESIRETNEEKEQKFKIQHLMLNEAKHASGVAKKERARLAINLENHEYTQTQRYARVCSICQNSNPSRRAAMVNCGHLVCLNCAETLSNHVPGATIACPVCRRLSKYARIYEDLESEREVPSRKRKHEDEGSPSVTSTSN